MGEDGMAAGGAAVSVESTGQGVGQFQRVFNSGGGAGKRTGG
jgi:hypothetical protein